MNQIKEFVGLMGRKRFTILAVVLAITGGMGYLWQHYLLPQHDKMEMEKRSVESALNDLRNQIEELPAKYEDLKEKEARYVTVLNNGFTDGQDRIIAREKLDKLRVEAGLRGIQYNINPQNVIEHPNDYMMVHKIVQSEITVDFKSLTDLEMRDFIYKMTHEFGDLVVFKSAEFKREQAVTPANLARLSNKTPVDFASGKASFVWYGLVEKDRPKATLQEQAFGGVSQ